MSVSIYPVDGGRMFPRREERRPCEACAGGWCQPGWCVNGVEIEQVATTPECNFANDNARVLLATIGLDPGPYLSGEIEPVEVASILAEVEAALEADAGGMLRRAPTLRAESHGRGGRGCRWHTAGSSDARACERLEAVRSVLRWALDHGAGVAWA